MPAPDAAIPNRKAACISRRRPFSAGAARTLPRYRDFFDFLLDS